MRERVEKRNEGHMKSNLGGIERKKEKILAGRKEDKGS